MAPDAAWVAVWPGSFMMGQSPADPCEPLAVCGLETGHTVTISRAFALARTEVTQQSFEDLMGYNPSLGKSCGPDCPVERVSWHEAAHYCNALSARDGLQSCYACLGDGAAVRCSVASPPTECSGYRLPTEAEWEYAYRAGGSTSLHNGPIVDCQGLDSNADAIAWFDRNAANRSHRVGEKLPNAWGLYDMAGNVWEWCHDGRQQDLGSRPLTDPVVPPDGNSHRVMRGGSWIKFAQSVRASNRCFQTHEHS